MNKGDILGTLEGVPVHLVGIKGTGMVALAEILQAGPATDRLLALMNLMWKRDR